MRKKIYSDKDKKPEKIEQNKAKEIAGLVIYCLIVIAAMFLIIKYVGQRTDGYGPFYGTDSSGFG